MQAAAGCCRVKCTICLQATSKTTFQSLQLTERALVQADRDKANAILSAGKRRARASTEPGAGEQESDAEAEVPFSQVQW